MQLIMMAVFSLAIRKAWAQLFPLFLGCEPLSMCLSLLVTKQLLCLGAYVCVPGRKKGMGNAQRDISTESPPFLYLI